MLIKWDGKDYDYDAERDLTVSRLRHIESWYPAMAGYLRFVNACAFGEPNAYACLLWIMRRQAGETTPEPMDMDFSIIAFKRAIEEASDVEAKRLGLGVEPEVDPTVGPTGPSPVPTTPVPDDSTQAPPSSEPST